MSMIDDLYGRIFGTVVVRGLPRPKWVAEEGDTEPLPIKRERLKVSLVVMSRQTERELMREDFNNSTGICSPRILGEPVRVFGVRIAFDESLAVGQFLLVEHVYGL